MRCILELWHVGLSLHMSSYSSVYRRCSHDGRPAPQGQVALIVLVTILSYVPLTIGVTEWRGRVRKRMNALDNDLGARATDMLLNYETARFAHPSSSFLSERRVH